MMCSCPSLQATPNSQVPLSKLIGNLIPGTKDNLEGFACSCILKKAPWGTKKPLDVLETRLELQAPGRSPSVTLRHNYSTYAPVSICKRGVNNCRLSICGAVGPFHSEICYVPNSLRKSKCRIDKTVRWSYTLCFGATCIPKINVKGFADMNAWRYG